MSGSRSSGSGVSRRGELGDLFGHVVLVRHVGDRQVPTDQRHHLAGAIAGGVDHDLAVDGVLVAPSAVREVTVHEWFGMLHQADDALEAADARAHRPRRACQRLRDLRRVDVAVEWIPQRADQVVGPHQRVTLDELLGVEHVVAHALGVRHAGDVAELGDSFVAVRQAHRAGDVVADRGSRRRWPARGRGQPSTTAPS